MESILFGHWIEVFLYIRCIGYIQHFWSGHFELYIRSRSWADFDVSQTDYTLLSRIQQKIWKLANGNIYDLLYDRSAERLVLEPQYLLYGVGEGFFERFIPYDGFEALLSPGVFVVFHVNEIHSSFFDVWFSYGLIPTTFLVYWTWKKCDLVWPGTAGGSAGTAGGNFYVDELQTAIFLVYYCDGRDLREEEKYGIWVKMDQGCFSREEYSWTAKWVVANFDVWLRISLASFLGIWYIYPIKHIFFFINYSNVSNVLN